MQPGNARSGCTWQNGSSLIQRRAVTATLCNSRWPCSSGKVPAKAARWLSLLNSFMGQCTIKVPLSPKLGNTVTASSVKCSTKVCKSAGRSSVGASISTNSSGASADVLGERRYLPAKRSIAWFDQYHPQMTSKRLVVEKRRQCLKTAGSSVVVIEHVADRVFCCCGATKASHAVQPSRLSAKRAFWAGITCSRIE